ncbi:unnamed protein product [Mycena citricolor]|uniref:Protein phosphatase n=1 Tax=Mycena citricolor TaxID=2018698 RepID=A0AAD2HBC1_9AGAR|nr:unnamed protein product [Mycena citricolor]CAK5273013.1 unnamed protein product [Mycena citricolor]
MKRPTFYTALPRVGRVRSNSATSRTLYSNPNSIASFFDASAPPPPPANARLTTHRVPGEARAELEGPQTNPHPTHAPLALASPHAPSNSHPHTAQRALFLSYTPNVTPKHPNAQPSGTARTQRRRGHKYTLDIGAYGIAKKGPFPRVRGLDVTEMNTDAPLAVQVGEDAYFVRENAMGVADGVGGWSRVKSLAPPTGPSASALFARRLMHFCADEIDHATHGARVLHAGPSNCSHSQPRHSSAFWDHLPSSTLPSHDSYDPYVPSSVYDSHSVSPSLYGSALDELNLEDLEVSLEEELEELADGLDVLSILERAYERTIRAHVVEVPASPSSPPDLRRMGASLKVPPVQTKTVPLRVGGSTALVAVLDYVPSPGKGKEPEGWVNLDSVERVKPEPVLDLASDNEGELRPVLKIAHLGDCMGLLVREDKVAWRSEEMWWRWNTPVQLSAAGASKPVSIPNKASDPSWWNSWSRDDQSVGAEGDVTPRSAAHTFVLPVQAGDILILASDGLGDNLWDEDVLDEVARVRELVGPVNPNEDSARLRRRTLAGLLGEALCSRARRLATCKERGTSCAGTDVLQSPSPIDETPFARRAVEAGKAFQGGKNDDISVVVAMIASAGHSSLNHVDAAWS